MSGQIVVLKKELKWIYHDDGNFQQANWRILPRKLLIKGDLSEIPENLRLQVIANAG